MPARISRGDPKVESIIAEMNALNAALRATANPADALEALQLVRQVLANRPPPVTFEDFLVTSAMSTIMAVDPPRSPPTTVSTDPWPQHVFETVGRAWVAWARGEADEAATMIRELREEPEHAAEPGREGAVHLMALHDWTRAIEALTLGQHDEATRFFKRAAEVGASFGTESHPIVLWTMAASLFPRPAAT